MTLPVNVGDKIHNGHWYEPAEVIEVSYIGPATEEDRETAKWLGYMLRPESGHCYVKYRLPNGAEGTQRFRLELDNGMLLSTNRDPGDPEDHWYGSRCRIVERAKNRQLDLFEVAL